ncbi:MAG: hypothetical protein EOP04_21955 [Proteobacteria bacterium]|nr:MAG: hypothetical protein EOP04_21955 [Pseudomonadota bacterium]
MAHFHRPAQLKPFLGLMIAAVIILNNIGCERVNNSLDEVRLECGTDFRPVSDDSLKLKLIGPGDQSLDTRSTTALGLKESGETIDLPISSRSCLSLPASVTSVRMKSTVSGQVIGSVLYADKLNKKSLNKIELSKVPTFTADFVCPDEGYYGKDRVNVNIASEVDGLSENIGVQILARSVSTKTVFPLKEKKLGLALSLLGDDLDISQLPSGTYQLELATTDLGRGLKENYSLTSGRKSCELHKVDAMPTLGKSEGRVVVSSHKTLFESDGSFKIYTCKVELATIKNLNACEVPAACEGDDKFVQSFKVLSESPGAFRYFYFHTDKANQRSNVSCKDIIVSETPPDLSIQWADPKYSFPTATVDKPIAKIALKISVGHSVVNREILNKNLMCSASFRIKPTLEIPASMITCESAECKGMNMSKPVPCGESLILSLQGYYDSQEL